MKKLFSRKNARRLFMVLVSYGWASLALGAVVFVDSPIIAPYLKPLRWITISLAVFGAVQINCATNDVLWREMFAFWRAFHKVRQADPATTVDGHALARKLYKADCNTDAPSLVILFLGALLALMAVVLIFMQFYPSNADRLMTILGLFSVATWFVAVGTLVLEVAVILCGMAALFIAEHRHNNHIWQSQNRAER